MKWFNFFIVLFFLTVTGCGPPYYIIHNFETVTADHQMIAVLPFEMVYIGKQPKNLTDEDREALEAIESVAFQTSFYNEILRSTKSGRKPIRVEVQDYSRTVRLLEEPGISIQQSWYERCENLADILGVDAVVGARITKTRYMSDLASFGIDKANEVLVILAELNEWRWLPQGDPTSKEVEATYSLLGKDRGEVLWSFIFRQAADWSMQSNAIIDNINRQGAKKFPYRKK